MEKGEEKKRAVVGTTSLPIISVLVPAFGYAIGNAGTIGMVGSFALRNFWPNQHALVTTAWATLATPVQRLLGTYYGSGAAAVAPVTTIGTSSLLPGSNTMLWGMSSMLMWKGFEAAEYLFKQRHGSIMQARLEKESALKLQDALLMHNKNNNEWLSGKEDEGLLWKNEYFDQMGRQAPEWLKRLSKDDKIVIGGVLAAFATYLERIGCAEMKKRTSDLTTDYKYPVEAGLKSEDGGYIEDFMFNKLNGKRLCYDLYSQNEYYTNTNPNKKIPEFDNRLGNNNIIRIIANTMIGFLQTFRFMNPKADPIEMFLIWAEATGYWEVLARLLGMYGWAPVYIASHWIAQTMTSGRKQKYIKKETLR